MPSPNLVFSLKGLSLMEGRIFLMKNKIFIFLFVSLFTLYSGCRKHADNLPPVITIVKPFPNKQVSPGDTLHVIAEIRDEELITKVLVQLVDGEGVPVGPARETQVGQAEYTLDTWYVIPANLEFGTAFSLLVRAFDDTEYKNKYCELLISFPDPVRRGVIVVTTKSTLIKSVYLIDTLLQVQPMFEAPGDSGASLLWEEKQLLALAGDIYGDLLIYSLYDTNLSWSLPAVQDPPFSYFTGLSASADLLMVGFQEGFISGYSSSGVKTVQTPASASFIPRHFLKWEDEIAGYWDDRLNSGGRIYWHYLLSGAVRHFASFPDEVLGVDVSSDGTFCVFGNSAGHARIWEESSGVMNILVDIPQHTLRCGQCKEGDEYIVALDDGVYIAYWPSNSISAIIPGVAADLISYDSRTGIVMAAQGKSIYLRNVSGGPVLSVNLPYSVTGIHPWYSR